MYRHRRISCLRTAFVHDARQRLGIDEIIRALKGARNQLVDLEDLSDEDLKKLEEQFRRLRTKAERNGTRSRKVKPRVSR